MAANRELYQITFAAFHVLSLKLAALAFNYLDFISINIYTRYHKLKLFDIIWELGPPLTAIGDASRHTPYPTRDSRIHSYRIGLRDAWRQSRE